MIVPELYLAVSGVRRPQMGGQELILYEVLALLEPYGTIWLPYPGACKTLSKKLILRDHVVEQYVGRKADALYFGTPTIVSGKPLFGVVYGIINKRVERESVQGLVSKAEAVGVRRIVSGLGSGDISVAERLEDMGGGEVVVEKKFDAFTDWVLVRDL